MTRMRVSLLLCPLVLAVAGCGSELSVVVHGIDHRLEAAERRAAEEGRRTAALAEQVARLQRMLAELAARVQGIAASLEATRRGLQSHTQEPHPAARVAVAAPVPPTTAEVRILETRVFRRAGVPRGLQPALGPRLGAVRECFRTRVLAADATVTGAVWVLYGQIGASAFGGRVAGNAPGHAPMNACLLRHLVAAPARLAPVSGGWQPAGGERIAQLVAYGPTAAAVARVPRPGFAWPWPAQRARFAGKGEVCAYGRGPHGGSEPLDPEGVRPCAAGLRCCYPCGIAGCNSVCLPRCPVGLP